MCVTRDTCLNVRILNVRIKGRGRRIIGPRVARHNDDLNS
jgi:hypothetical protein